MNRVSSREKEKQVIKPKEERNYIGIVNNGIISNKNGV